MRFPNDFKITHLIEYTDNKLSDMQPGVDMDIHCHFNVSFPDSDTHVDIVLSRDLMYKIEGEKYYQTNLYRNTSILDKDGNVNSLIGESSEKGSVTMDYLYFEVVKYAQKNIPELKSWADDFIRQYLKIDDQLVQTKLDHYQSIKLPGKEELHFSIESDYGEIHNFDDIDYFLVDSDNINSESTLSELVIDILDYDTTRISLNKSKDDILSFYQAKILPTMSLSKESLTPEQQEDLDLFSDWHKDLYGHRPRGLDNEVQRKIDAEKDNTVEDEREDSL